jgi:hypothetical protein
MTHNQCEKGALFLFHSDLQVKTRVTLKNSDNNSDRVGIVLIHFISR